MSLIGTRKMKRKTVLMKIQSRKEKGKSKQVLAQEGKESDRNLLQLPEQELPQQMSQKSAKIQHSRVRRSESRLTSIGSRPRLGL